MKDVPHPEISVVVPVYNSEATLHPLVDRVFAVFDKMDRPGEIIFVDDGSQDRSWSVIEELSTGAPDAISAVRLMRNFGQHNALMCGFHLVRGKIVVTIDDDLQNPPEEIPKLVAALEAEALDLVYGDFYEKMQAGWRNAGSQLVAAFYRYVFGHGTRPSSFRAFRSDILPSLLEYNLNFTYVDGLLNWSTTRIGSVPVLHEARQTGQSGYSLGKLILLAINLFTNFSILPLQLVSIFGIAFATLGFLGAVFYFVQYALGGIDVPGFATVVIVLLITGGVQMLALGIIGEYLGRLHLNVNRKPQFVIREIRGADDRDVTFAGPGRSSSWHRISERLQKN
ncbi:MAG: glycosyltransferase [Pseudomonadota bacterium]